MRIDINQQKIALGDKFEIVQHDETVLRAESKLFRFLSEIILFRPVEKYNIAIIKEKFRLSKHTTQ
jgi:hypothetical protein